MSLGPEGDGNISFIAKEASSPVPQHSSRGGGRMAPSHRSDDRGDQGDETNRVWKKPHKGQLMHWILVYGSYM